MQLRDGTTGLHNNERQHFMTELEHDEDDRVLGEGLLALGSAERDSGRWGAVFLTDLDGVPIPLRGIPEGQASALTAALLPETDRIDLPLRRELLGAGAVFTEQTATDHGGAIAVGVRPSNGRLTSWLHAPTVGRLLGYRVRLEAHPAWLIRSGRKAGGAA